MEDWHRLLEVSDVSLWKWSLFVYLENAQHLHIQTKWKLSLRKLLPNSSWIAFIQVSDYTNSTKFWKSNKIHAASVQFTSPSTIAPLWVFNKVSDPSQFHGEWQCQAAILLTSSAQGRCLFDVKQLGSPFLSTSIMHWSHHYQQYGHSILHTFIDMSLQEWYSSIVSTLSMLPYLRRRACAFFTPMPGIEGKKSHPAKTHIPGITKNLEWSVLVSVSV